MKYTLFQTLRLALALLVTAEGAGAVMPPAAEVETPAGFGAFFARQNRLYRAGFSPQSRDRERPLLARAAPQKISFPVILASYSDRPGVIAAGTFTQLLFGSHPTGALAQYYAEVSGGRFAVGGQVFGWVSAQLTQAQYTTGGPLGERAVFPQSPEGFVAHAVAAADSQVDFGRFDNDGPDGAPNSGDDDGFVDALVVVHPGGDAAAGDSKNFWSHTSSLGPQVLLTDDPAAGGGFIRVDRYSLVPELAGAGGSAVPVEIGVICHEFGHQLGLPDLYGTASGSTGGGGEVISNGIGVWGLMGLGAYGGDGRSPSRPTHLCAWSKLRLGWVSLAGEAAQGSFTLEPVGQSYQVVRLWDNADRAPGYFLLAFRARQGFDSALPGEGLLIWHVDEGAFDNNDPAHKLVDLEQADGRSDLDRAVNTGDSGDPFPGAANNTSFSGSTSPSSLRYDGLPSGVEVTSIRLEEGKAVFNLIQPQRERLTVLYDEDGPREKNGFGYGNSLAHGAVLFTAPLAGALEAVSTYFIYENMDYTIELYSGMDSGRMRCPVSWQAGALQGPGWRTLALEQPVYLEAGDTVVLVVGYTGKGYDDESPVPYDATGKPEGRSYVSFSGLGVFEPYAYDISIRAVLRPGTREQTGGLSLAAGFEVENDTLNFGRTFTGEIYALPLPLHNPGLRELILQGIEAAGEGFSVAPFTPNIGCGETLEAGVLFEPRAYGTAAGTVTVRPLNGPSAAAGVRLSASVEGWSVRYDSSAAPAAYDVYTESAHGAVEFSLGAAGLLAGVRTYLPRDSMRLGLTIWAEKKGGGGHCRVAGTDKDTLIAEAGWRQLFLPLPVEIDSADTFIADIEYATPGREYNYLIPVDTLHPAPHPSYYNLRTRDSWTLSPHPVAIHALLVDPGAYSGPRVRKKAAAGLSRSALAFDSLEVGRAADRGLWLINSGSAYLQVSVSAAGDDDSVLFTPAQDSLAIACEDSVWLELRCLAESPGIHTGVLEIRTSDSERPLLRVSLTAEAALFMLALDEQGHTASAGFNDTLAYGTVVFNTPWPGALSGVRLYLNQPGMQAGLSVFLAVGDGPLWTDSVAGLPDTLIPVSGWQELTLARPLYFGAGDSFALRVRLVSPDLYPLPIDHRGAPSGKSWASRSLDGPWEKLTYDLNLRAVLESEPPQLYPVSGRVLAADGQPLAGTRVSLVSEGLVYRAESDAAGAFTISGVAGGTYSLSAALEGYRFASRTVNVSSELDNLALTGREYSAGDLDGDGMVNIFDLLALLQALAGVKPLNGSADVNLSGTVDILDLLELLRILAD